MGITSVYYNILHTLEENHVLDITNSLHLFCCHYVFLPRIQESFDVFREGWDNYPIRTEHNLMPNQLWQVGQFQNPVLEPEFKAYRSFKTPRRNHAHPSSPVRVRLFGRFSSFASGPSFRSERRASKRKSSASLPPARSPPHSPASSYASANPKLPTFRKWTIQSRHRALTNAEVPFSRRMSKLELYTLYVSSQTDAPPVRSDRMAANDESGSARGPIHSRQEQSSTAARHGLHHSRRRSSHPANPDDRELHVEPPSPTPLIILNITLIEQFFRQPISIMNINHIQKYLHV
ncbi:hypothetical protein E1301_Tti020705 [Triplophysa tibetana]|uniref:Integrase core domain-containing protein n=1 Tax=Triplophysa tibetana TaxID=1572043 RepID=A0A5A9PI80_9TELE|nr:hypothetical protein E1301_Tti020705 [Triplophysa tibetana]